MPKTVGKLTAKQEAFCREYLIDLNATQAAIRAGYQGKTCGAMGHALLKKHEISSRIQSLMNERAARVDRSADDVLRDLGDVRRDAMTKIVDKDGNRIMANHSAALKALELEGKHLKIFTDRTEHTGANGGPVDVNLKVSFVRP